MIRVNPFKLTVPIVTTFLLFAHKQHAGSTQKRVQASEEEPRILIENLKTHKVYIQVEC